MSKGKVRSKGKQEGKDQGRKKEKNKRTVKNNNKETVKITSTNANEFFIFLRTNEEEKELYIVLL